MNSRFSGWKHASGDDCDQSGETMSLFTPPTPEEREERRRLLALPFRMPIEDIFIIKGHGLVVTGRVQTGTLREDPILIVGNRETLQAQAMRFEIFGHLEFIEAGDNIGILLSKNVSKDQLEIGIIITTEGL
jgi:elongation factor Tu